MIIKVIPENDVERATMKEVEHKNVKEFFMFGNKIDEEGSMMDFHDWNGSYRYLIGSLFYFTKVVQDEKAAKDMERASRPSPMFKSSDPVDGKVINIFDKNKFEKGITGINEQAPAEPVDGEVVAEPEIPAEDN